ncbi:MAG: DNA-processing protein DprA [Candidatus Zixiibacteriota bacterium]
MNIENYSLSTQIWALREYAKVGPRTFKALIARFGNVAAIHQAEVEEIKSIDGLGEKRAATIYGASEKLDEAQAFIKSLDEINVGHYNVFDDAYPALFEELNDPPPIIFCRGEVPSPDEKTCAIVGSHNATNEGIAFAVDLAEKLAKKGVSIVSGLARGIDTAGHIGALKGEGKTYAILGSGLENVYPEENRPLAIEIRKHGGLISEYAPDKKNSIGGLMSRNRLIVGLSQAVVIGEVFPESSGTLDTAKFCNEIGKIMFILIDGIDMPNRDNSAVEEIIGWGAIPISLSDDIDMIVKVLV